MSNSPHVSFITKTIVMHKLSASNPIPEDNHESPWAIRGTIQREMPWLVLRKGPLEGL